MSASDFEDQCQDLDEAWECPTCLRPMPEEHDYEFVTKYAPIRSEVLHKLTKKQNAPRRRKSVA